MNHAVSRDRTRNYVSQIKSSFIFKGLAILASFVAIPVLIRYLGHDLFGVWSTILSVMSWIFFFDLGIGNGLRNKVAEAFAKNDSADAARYIASGYTLIGLISLSLCVITTVAAFCAPWQKIFNTNAVSEEVLRHVVLIVALFISLNFFVSLINQVLSASLKTSAIIFGQFLGNALVLALVYGLSLRTDRSILYVATAYGISLIAPGVILTIWFYNQRRDLIPKLRLDNQHVRPLLSLGLKFFALQIAVLVIFFSQKLLIVQIFGPQHVTQFDVVYKLFAIFTLIHSIVTAPLLPSYSDAYHRGDFGWITRMLRRQYVLFASIVVAVAILVAAARPIIRYWIGADLEISMPLVIAMAAFVVVSIWSNIFANFVNGIGEISLQMKSLVISMFLNIPLSIFLTKGLGMGVHGIVFASVLSLLVYAVLGPFQVATILRRKTATVSLEERAKY